VGVARRRPAPEDVPVRGVDRQRDPVGGRDEERVVRRAVDGDAVQVDRGGIDRAGQVDLLANERAHVRRRDPGRVRVVVRAARVPAEPRPVGTRARDRLVRTRNTPGRATAAAGSQQEPGEGEQKDSSRTPH
jgi:hypothetical protein